MGTRDPAKELIPLALGPGTLDRIRSANAREFLGI
jgi:hypothetical protein